MDYYVIAATPKDTTRWLPCFLVTGVDSVLTVPAALSESVHFPQGALCRTYNEQGDILHMWLVNLDMLSDADVCSLVAKLDAYEQAIRDRSI